MKITEEEFFEKYKPIQNPYTKGSGWNNTMFETYGKEIDYVTSSNFSDRQIWTLVDCVNEECYIIPGFHFVDRNGYFITEIPWENENIEVNCNEMITKKQAINACINFFKELKFTLDRYNVHNFFTEEEYSIGEAKYTATDYWETLGNELTSEQEDLIHDYYSNLI